MTESATGQRFTAKMLMDIIDMYANAHTLFIRSKHDPRISAEDTLGMGKLRDGFREVVDDRVRSICERAGVPLE